MSKTNLQVTLRVYSRVKRSPPCIGAYQLENGSLPHRRLAPYYCATMPHTILHPCGTIHRRNEPVYREGCPPQHYQRLASREKDDSSNDCDRRAEKIRSIGKRHGAKDNYRMRRLVGMASSALCLCERGNLDDTRYWIEWKCLVQKVPGKTARTQDVLQW